MPVGEEEIENEGWYSVIGWACAVGIALILSVAVTYGATRHYMRADAVRSGAGMWTSDLNGNPTFVWIDSRNDQ